MTNVELLQLAISMRYAATYTERGLKSLEIDTKEQILESVEYMTKGLLAVCDQVIEHLQELDHISDSEIEMRVEAFHREMIAALAHEKRAFEGEPK